MEKLFYLKEIGKLNDDNFIIKKNELLINKKKFDPNLQNNFDFVCVSHIRKDQVYSIDNNENLFVFQWKINCIYNVNTFDYDKIDLELVDFFYDDEKSKKNFKNKTDKIKKIFNFVDVENSDE
jgi:hypothetical protein